jgi:beta-glucosidase
MVTENGAAFPDESRAEDGSVLDLDRVAYLRDHLAAVHRARAARADVRGYVAWTLLDNFEWAEGYTKKFGLVEIRKDSLDRVPKESFRWYARQTRADGPA